jgi:ABC-type Fe3+ transport system permease subunit
MRPAIKKLYLFGFHFIISTVLLYVPIGFASAHLVSQNFTHQLNLGLLGYDFFWTVLLFSTLEALGMIGIILLIASLLAHLIDKLAQKILMPHPKS